jgi:hypothetical protein
MAAKPKPAMGKPFPVASIWHCDTCGATLYAADCPKRVRCRYCRRFMARTHPR